MSSAGEDVYATLLLNDSYLPGALVLAHSLRDAGTTKKLAVLITTDTISTECIAELEKLYDYIVPVERIVNQTPANLFLMGRGDLHSTFTKINLWKLLQFRRIVYLDADIVALRAPDELFDLPQPFSAAPDIGWPDLFNSGLLVLNPNMGDYYALLAMAQRGISFDGADQGLLNIHFKNSYNRLSFTYNVTPSAHYQYLPAYRHFQSSISLAHFIGTSKPWTVGREASRGQTPYDELSGRWWAVYDRHYRESSLDASTSAPQIVQYHTKGEFIPPSLVISGPPAESGNEPTYHSAPQVNESQPAIEEPSPIAQIDHSKVQEIAEPTVRVPQFAAWDASKAPPPSDSRPEAANFPHVQYNMTSDVTPFKAPARYPDPPKNMYYEVPKAPTYQKPAPIFPWEKDASKPTRVFQDDTYEQEPITTSKDEEEVVVAPTTPTLKISPADPWQAFTRGNAWDEIPEIERYIGQLQKNRKGNIQVLQGYGTGIEQVSSPSGQRRQSLKLTDFPTELERPSLPVTPAPIRRPSFWGEERDQGGDLPGAEGVPSQAEWDPSAQLDLLARHQSEVLASKLSLEDAREIPSRSLPYGSEGVISPTYIPQVPRDGNSSHTTTPRMEQPSFSGPGASFEKGETFPTKETPLLPSEEEKDVLET